MLLWLTYIKLDWVSLEWSFCWFCYEIMITSCFFCTNAGFGEMVVKSSDTVGVVEALDIVARWCIVGAPLGLFLVGRSCSCNTCKHGSWYEGLRELLCEGLVGDCCLSCCRGSRCWWNPSLRTPLRAVQPWVAYDVVYCDILTVSIISPQLLCFRGTITSSMSSRAIQSNLNRSLRAYVCVFGDQESL